jgi:hypothetical protein
MGFFPKNHGKTMGKNGENRGFQSYGLGKSWEIKIRSTWIYISSNSGNIGLEIWEMEKDVKVWGKNCKLRR